MNRDYERIAAAIRHLEAHAGAQPSLDEVAGVMGLAPHHAQRVFKRWAGVSPKRFLQALAAEQAKARLDDDATVLDAAYDAGLSGPGRLHDLMVHVEAVTPGEARRLGAGLEIRYGVAPTPFGAARIARTPRGVCALAFLEPDDDPDAASLRAAWPAATWLRDDEAVAPTAEAAFGTPGKERIPLLVRGTNLQMQVWRALLKIPEGRVLSYQGLARALGRPSAARAVAGAVAANAIGYLIPCHRVLRASGAIGGYRWGTTRKRAMLAREAALVTDYSIP